MDLDIGDGGRLANSSKQPQMGKLQSEGYPRKVERADKQDPGFLRGLSDDIVVKPIQGLVETAGKAFANTEDKDVMNAATLGGAALGIPVSVYKFVSSLSPKGVANFIAKTYLATVTETLTNGPQPFIKTAKDKLVQTAQDINKKPGYYSGVAMGELALSMLPIPIAKVGIPKTLLEGARLSKENLLIARSKGLEETLAKVKQEGDSVKSIERHLDADDNKYERYLRSQKETENIRSLKQDALEGIVDKIESPKLKLWSTLEGDEAKNAAHDWFYFGRYHDKATAALLKAAKSSHYKWEELEPFLKELSKLENHAAERAAADDLGRFTQLDEWDAWSAAEQNFTPGFDLKNRRPSPFNAKKNVHPIDEEYLLHAAIQRLKTNPEAMKTPFFQHVAEMEKEHAEKLAAKAAETKAIADKAVMEAKAKEEARSANAAIEALDNRAKETNKAIEILTWFFDVEDLSKLTTNKAKAGAAIWNESNKAKILTFDEKALARKRYQCNAGPYPLMHALTVLEKHPNFKEQIALIKAHGKFFR